MKGLMMIEFGFSKAYQRLIVGFRSAVHGVVMLAGLWALIATPRTIAGAAGFTLTAAWASLAAAGGAVALVGALRRSVRLEFLAIWWSAGGVSAYVVTVWSLVATETSTRGVQALICSGLLLSLCSRGAELAAKVSQVRKLRDSMEG